MSLRRLAATASILALGLAAPAFAQSAQPAEVDTLVVTAGSQVNLPTAYAGGQVARGSRVGLFGAMDVMDTPFSTTAYTAELARNQQARSVADVLQNDPVIRVARGFGNFQEVYIVRGFPLYSDDVAYNGVYGILPRQFVAAEFIERFEAFRGASAFLNGAAPGGSGVGGAFNLVPKRAGETPLNRVTAGVESGGNWLAAADLSRRFGPDQAFGVRANLAHRDGETAVDNQDRTLSVASLGMDYRGDKLRFSADAGYQDHHIKAPRPSVTPAGAIPGAPDDASNFAQPWTYTDEKQLFGAVRGEYDLTDTISAWAAAGARRGKEDNVLANPTAQPNGVLSSYRFDNIRKDRVVSADVGLKADVQTGSVGHRLVASASAISSRSRNAYAFSNFAGFTSNLYTPIVVAPPAANFFTGGSFSDPKVTERVKNTSFALADMVTLFDGKVLATVGARRQEIETSAYDYNTGVRGSHYKSHAITPAVGLVVKPSDQVSLYANYSEALVPGQVAPAVSGGVTLVNAGEVLKPFRAKQYETGVKYDGGRFGGTLSLFSIAQPVAVVTAARLTNNGEERHRGVELSVFGEPVEGMRLLGGLTLLNPEVRKTQGGLLDGKNAVGVPERQINFNLEYDLPWVAGLTLEERIVHTGPQYADGANSIKLDSWTRVDFGARYSFESGGKPITLRARVENVTGTGYWASVGGYPGANYLVLGAPRTFLLSASVDF